MARKKDGGFTGRGKTESEPDMDIVRAVTHNGSAEFGDFEPYDRFSDHVVRNAENPTFDEWDKAEGNKKRG